MKIIILIFLYISYCFCLNFSQSIDSKKLKILENKPIYIIGIIVFNVFNLKNSSIFLHFENCFKSYYKCDDFDENLQDGVPFVCKEYQG